MLLRRASRPPDSLSAAAAPRGRNAGAEGLQAPWPARGSSAGSAGLPCSSGCGPGFFASSLTSGLTSNFASRSVVVGTPGVSGASGPSRLASSASVLLVLLVRLMGEAAEVPGCWCSLLQTAARDAAHGGSMRTRASGDGGMPPGDAWRSPAPGQPPRRGSLGGEVAPLAGTRQLCPCTCFCSSTLVPQGLSARCPCVTTALSSW
mmetsp:Transcript_56844/g.166418  ORF Transcript_56844/g.166418 Transcript_56844/m.166418 type:complete len:205 (-) Transcript_56844:204-818(-)